MVTLQELGSRAIAEKIPDDMLARPPIDIERIAVCLGVRQIISDDLGADGMLYPVGRNGFVIVVDKNHSPRRKRFSCAHEVGHILLGQGANMTTSRRVSSHAGEALEKACNEVAAEILMPRPLFVKHAAAVSWRWSALPDLADTFQTSIEATAARYVETIDEPCLLCMWRLANISGHARVKLVRYRKNARVGPHDFQFDAGVRQANIALLMKNRGLNNVGGSYERVRVTNGTAASFKTVYTECLAYGSGQNRRVINAIYPSRRQPPSSRNP